ncbi:MAG: potassium-transporting ATPase subunit F [Thermoplasmata archaeon]|nr:potassium-transporting ATPase subunit F [Thermoplasmata archaeon]
MDLVNLLAANLGLLVFTVVAAGLFVYLFYAMLFPTRF